MRYLIGFLRFWRDFLIGDDVWGALIGIAGFVLTWFLVRAGIVAWWLLPVTVVASVAFSVWRKVREARARAQAQAEEAQAPAGPRAQRDAAQRQEDQGKAA